MEYGYCKPRLWSAADKAQPAGEKRTARARINGVNASYKDLCEVCRNVRGRDAQWAISFLEQAAEKKRAIYFARHASGMGHRRELGGRKGSWPVKSVRIVLEVLKSAAANAGRAGIADAKIAHIAANKRDTLPRLAPKGKRKRNDYETAFVEVVLEECQKKAGEEKPKAPKGKRAVGTPAKVSARVAAKPVASAAANAEAAKPAAVAKVPDKKDGAAPTAAKEATAPQPSGQVGAKKIED